MEGGGKMEEGRVDGSYSPRLVTPVSVHGCWLLFMGGRLHSWVVAFVRGWGSCPGHL